MKFQSLDGREIRRAINPGKYPLRSRARSKSEPQYLLGRLIKKIYPASTILEEFSIPDERLSLDFYIPSRKIAFEFDGEQHKKYNKFFHGDKSGFERQKSRDKRKTLWCEINDITLVRIDNRNISLPELRQAILEAL